MMLAVIDTNVLVSALITHNSNAATVKVLKHLFLSHITPLYNEEIIEEYDEVLHRKKFKLAEEQIRIVLDFVRQNGINSSRCSYNGIMPDEDDRVFYEVSLSEDSSFLVTGNLKHFPCTPKVITAAKMVEILEQNY